MEGFSWKNNLWNFFMEMDIQEIFFYNKASRIPSLNEEDFQEIVYGKEGL